MGWAKTTQMVAEVQGLYGPFTFSELLLQRIWARGDFDQTRLQTVDGRRVTVEHRGRWNTLGGPDFRQARVRWDDGRTVTGDVELHLRAEDWDAHGHAADRAYGNVVLHVVLFTPRVNHVTRGGSGQPLPVVPMLPLLWHDLEEYAAEEAVEHLADHRTGRLREALLALAPKAVTARLQRGAMKRWQQKVHYAERRVQRLGFAAACHCTALEILGFRFNRVPMLNVAARHPLAEWACVTEADIEGWLREEASNWARVGVRPANHPKLRLG
ncbi:MAG: hypothetical protein RIS54_867 [Verrucomicrobiota bacterium]|jgi:hypothetical protein